VSSISSSYGKSPTDDPTRLGGTAKKANAAPKKEHELDSYANQNLLKRLLNWYDHEWQQQAGNRYQMALDCDYYDSMQWTDEEAAILAERGQAPLVFNEIKPTVDWMIGTERRTRIDYKILPRKAGKEASKDAENKTMLLKYLSDVNKAPFQRSQAFDSAIKAGVGWIEVGVRGDPTDELLYTRNEDWRNCLYDSNSVEMDGSDMRYFFRQRWLDDDIALAYFPDRQHIIEQAIVEGDSTLIDEEDIWYMGTRVTRTGQDYAHVNNGRYQPYAGSSILGATRSRVKLKECWYRVPVLKRKFSRGQFENEIFDSKNQEHINALKGGFSVYDKLELEVRCAIFCSAGLLFDGKSPYKHGRIPFVPVWCYRRKRDNAPYGIIRPLRDPQDDLNKRHSKAQWILSTNRVIADKGAVDDWDDLRAEVARPNPFIIKNTGKEINIDRDIALAGEHLKLMDADTTYIRNAGGVNNENLGRQSNASSGIALQERKESGSVTTTAPFDNLHFAVQLAGELELSNVEQFYSEEKTIRITGERGTVKFEEINKIDEETGAVLNDITEFQADFVVSEQDYRSSLRQAMFESLFDIVGRLAQMNPQIALNMLDLVIEMADLPNKDELVARIRKINGQSDPSKEEEPEEMAARQQQEQAQQQEMQLQQQMALETIRNQLAKLVAETGKLDAQAMEIKIQAMYSALQAAGVVATIPAAGKIADEILKGAGYQDASIRDNAAMIDQAAQEMPPEQQAPEQQVPNMQQPAAAAGINAGIQTPEIEGMPQ
jgi:hypothetical protein